jgi:hypothetical protein
VDIQKNKKQERPKNTHPERLGQALVPNYDALMNMGSSSVNNGTSGGNIDLVAVINQLGGISNWEKYKLIAEIFSSRVMIYNP